MSDKYDKDKELPMSEEEDEVPITTGELDTLDKPLEERVAGPTSIDVADEQNSMEEALVIGSQEEKPQEQKRGMEPEETESRTSKRIQKRRRITSYLSNISKQIEKQGNQINKLTSMIQSLQKQKQSKSITGTGVDKLQSQSIKQIKSQINQLQKQVTRIQNDIQKIRTVSATKTKLTKLIPSTTNVKSRSKKIKSLKNSKARKSKRSR
jgi:hypothetical protein